jgi:hypothetical protein
MKRLFAILALLIAVNAPGDSGNVTAARRSASRRRMKSLLLVTLICFSFLSTGYAQDEKRFGSITVRDDKLFGTERPRNEFLIDFDGTFAWVSGERRDSGTNATFGLFVLSKPHHLWLQIAETSTTGARLGKSSQLVAQPWDFTGFASKDFVPLPIPSLFPPYPGKHFPDAVTFDETRETFVLHFDSRNTLESEKTTVLVPKTDLTTAFDYYSKPKSHTPNAALEPTATAPTVSTNK